MKSKKKIVLAYSGGLDTSIILKWLQENYNTEVICYKGRVGRVDECATLERWLARNRYKGSNPLPT